MTIASLLNLSAPDMFIILGIVLLLYGSKNLSELARGMEQTVRKFSMAKGEFKIGGPEILAIIVIASIALLLAAAAGLINRHP